MLRSVWEFIDAHSADWRRLALLLVGIAGLCTLAFIAAYLTAPTTTDSVVTARHAPTTTVSTYSVVQTNSNPLYSDGEVVRNVPLYDIETMPMATVTATTRFPESEAFRVNQTLLLVVTATHDGQPFWSDRKVLSRSTLSLAQDDNRTVTTSTTLSMTRLRSRMKAVETAYSGRGTLKMSLVVTASYQGAHTGTLRTKLPLKVGRHTYKLGAGEAMTQRVHTHTTPQKQQRPLSHAKPFGIAAMLSLFCAGVSGLLLRTADPTRTAWDYQLAAYDEWISTGTVHTVGMNACIEEASIEDLVQVAIDSDTRVVHDPTEEVCLVVAGNGDIVHYCTRGDTEWTPPTSGETDDAE